MGCFHVLVIVDSNAMNIRVHVSLNQNFLGLYALEWDCRIKWQLYFQFFKRVSLLFSTVAVPTYILINSVGGLHFLYSLSNLYYWQTFQDGHSDWCEVTLHCSFGFHFSDTNVLSIFASDVEYLHVPFGHLHDFFREMFIQIFCPFCNWVVCLGLFFLY